MDGEGKQPGCDGPIPHVFISFEELDISGSSGITSMAAVESKSRKVRRPDVLIYQPGAAKKSLGKVKDKESCRAVDKIVKYAEEPCASTQPGCDVAVRGSSEIERDESKVQESGRTVPSDKSTGQRRKNRPVQTARRGNGNDLDVDSPREAIVKDEVTVSDGHGKGSPKSSQNQGQRKPEVEPKSLGRKAVDGRADMGDTRSAVPNAHNKQASLRSGAKTAQLSNRKIAAKSAHQKPTSQHRQKCHEATIAVAESSPFIEKCAQLLNDGDASGTHESAFLQNLSSDHPDSTAGQPSNAGDGNNHDSHKDRVGKTQVDLNMQHATGRDNGSRDSSNLPRSAAGLLNIGGRADVQASRSADVHARSLYDPHAPLADQSALNRPVKDGNSTDTSVQYYYGSRVHPAYSTYPVPALDPAYMLPLSTTSTYNYNTPSFYQHESPIDASSDRPSGRQSKVAAILRDVIPLDKQLNNLVSRRFSFSDDYLEHINRLRGTVREKLEQALLMDVEYSTNNNIDQLLWKSVYHQVLESLRSQLQSDDVEPDVMEVIRSQINLVLDEAGDNYRSLLAKLEKLAQFDLSTYTAAHSARTLNRGLKFSLMMCQKILICLGDVARYRAQNCQTGATDYGLARKFYLQASFVAPKNGKPYNQLAITALHAKRRLDTVYYFVRSIAASNAFLSAKESLQAIYNEIMKKRNVAKRETEKKKLKSKQVNQQNVTSSHKRIECWISPLDGTSVTDHVDTERDDGNPTKMPCNEVYRTLMTSFLCSQGMIYSKVSMEDFGETSSQVLYYLQALISHSPLPQLDLFKLTQMCAIAMFSIAHTGQLVDVGGVQVEKCRSYTQEQAILLYMDMVTVISERCTTLLEAGHTLSYVTTSDLLHLLPLVSLYTDWMSCHPHLWNPAPCPRDPALGPVLDPWSSMAHLANTLLMIRQVQDIKLYTSQEATDDEHIWLMIEEEQTLKGFLPLMNLANEDVYMDVHSPFSQVDAAMCYRVKKLVTFADYLCGIEPAILEFDISTCTYRSLVDPPSYSEQTTSSIAVSNLQKGAQVDEEAAQGLDVSNDDEAGEGITDQLRKTKSRLRRQLAKQERQQQLHQAVLDQESTGVLKINIRPIFVVPDTNCFIEYPNHMRVLVMSLKFTVVVPLVVINELDGISQSKPTHLHSAQARKHASTSLQFLQSQFEERNRRLKAITVSGNELTSIAFRTEESDLDGNNDDRILSCCLHYCKDVARDFMPRDRAQAVTLHREVVLLTDDRNLRLKAHASNVPVKDLIQFLEWANVRCVPC